MPQLDWWQWALALAAWFTTAGVLSALLGAAMRANGRSIDRHVDRALSNRERIQRGARMAAGDNQ